MVSSCTDKTIALWDFETGNKLRSFKGHTSFVNSCCYYSRGKDLIVSGSDDNTLKVKLDLFYLIKQDMGFKTKKCNSNN